MPRRERDREIARRRRRREKRKKLRAKGLLPPVSSSGSEKEAVEMKIVKGGIKESPSGIPKTETEPSPIEN